MEPALKPPGKSGSFSARRLSSSSVARSKSTAEHSQTPSDALKRGVSSSACLRDSAGESLSDQTDSSLTSKQSRSHAEWSHHSNPLPDSQPHSDAALEAAQRLLVDERAATSALRDQARNLHTAIQSRMLLNPETLPSMQLGPCNVPNSLMVSAWSVDTLGRLCFIDLADWIVRD